LAIHGAILFWLNPKIKKIDIHASVINTIIKYGAEINNQFRIMKAVTGASNILEDGGLLQ
jgi:hypothetical protein